MAEEIKPTETPNPALELTPQEKQAIEQQRMNNANIIKAKTEIEAVLNKYNMYLAVNGAVQVAGNVATPQLRIDILMK